jgi:hypothetical protein
MLPEYFGRAALRSMKLRRKIHIKSVMDGHGILGKIRINRSDNVELGVYMRSSASSQVVEKSYSNLIDIRGTVLDVISELKLNQPLRFHSGIRYIAKNSYISNEFFADDQQNAIPLTA